MAAMMMTPDDLQRFVLSDPLARDLAEIAQAHCRPMALVGGCVRDWLLGREPLDWDVVVPGDPTPLAKALLQRRPGAIVTLDADFGVVRTPLRSGVSVDFTRQQGDTLEIDLGRRDLALNALALRLDTGELVDPTGGMEDMELQRIRAVSRRNLEDDPLRLLRVYRFASTLAWRVEDTTHAWVEELAPMIAKPAGERILAELAKLLDGPAGPHALAEAYHAGLLASLFPEVAKRPTGLAQALRLYRGMVGDLQEMGEGPDEARTIEVFARPLAGDRTARVATYLAALLLPAAADEGAVAAVTERLKLSAKERSWIDHTVQGAIEAQSVIELEGREATVALHRFVRDRQAAAHGAALLALEVPPADDYATARRWVDWHHAFQRFYWAWMDERAVTPRLLSGGDLQKDLGLTPGPAFSAILDGVEEARTLGDVRTREEALAWAARKIAERE